jgi:hypothetical protein
MEDVGLDADSLDAPRTGVSMGAKSGEPPFIEEHNDIRKAPGEEAITGKRMGRYADQRPRGRSATWMPAYHVQ